MPSAEQTPFQTARRRPAAPGPFRPQVSRLGTVRGRGVAIAGIVIGAVTFVLYIYNAVTTYLGG